MFSATTSCLYEDLGNYDYDRFPEMKITNIEGNYGQLIINVDTVNIFPKIEFGEDNERAFDCKWYELKSTGDLLISETCELHYPVEFKGSIKLRFEATHRKTGLKCWAQSAFSGNIILKDGWYILKEMPDGDTDVDFHSRDTVTDKYKYTLIEDYVTKRAGKRMKGAPVGLDFQKIRYYATADSVAEKDNSIWVASREDLRIFEPEAFNQICEYEDMFFENILAEGERKIEGIYSRHSTMFLEVSTAVLVQSGGRARAMNVSKGSHYMDEIAGSYSLSEKVIGCKNGPTLMGYDKNSSSFHILSSPSMKLPVMKQQPKRPVNHLNSNLLYFGQGAGGTQKNGLGIALLSKKNAPDSLMLYQIDLFPLAINGINDTCRVVIDTITTNQTKLHLAEHYSMHQTNPILYYMVKGEVNTYNTATDKEEYNVLDYSNKGTVTWMKYVACSNTYNAKNSFNYLLIATHQNGEYCLNMHPVVGGVLAREPELLLKGKGKLHSAKYYVPNTKNIEYYVYF